MNDNETFEQLTDLVGEEAARRVAASFAGSPMYIPRMFLLSSAIRRYNKNSGTARHTGNWQGGTGTRSGIVVAW
jgi:hypothetical protein